MSYLELKGIHKDYMIGKQAFPVLKGIDMQFELGEFVAILGESGGGKTTLMNIISGLDRDFLGTVTLNGQPLDHHHERQLDRYRRETLGYISQSYNLINHLNVLDNVMLALDMTTLKRTERRQRAHDLLDRVGLATQLKKYPSQLSGGQKQRVAIARALAGDPQILVADEPTGALDADNTADVMAILQKIAADGRLVICVTHSERVAASASRVARLVDGRIASDNVVRAAAQPVKPHQQLTARALPWHVTMSTAFKHLRFTWSWNALIVLGTAIGLFAVMLFDGLGNGVRGYINHQINNVVDPQSITVMRYTNNAKDQEEQSAAVDPADDQLGFEWLCARLGTRKLPLTQVKVPLKQVLTTPGLHLRTYAQLDELDVDTIAGLSALTQPVSLTTRQAVAYEWDALLGDNAPLRVNLNGQLVGVPADFYDALIRPQLKSGRSRTRIVGETVGRYGVGVPSWWIAARVAQLRPSTKGQLS